MILLAGSWPHGQKVDYQWLTAVFRVCAKYVFTEMQSTMTCQVLFANVRNT